MSSKPNPQEQPYDEDGEPRDDAIIGRAFRWSLLAIVLLVLAAGAIRMLLLRPQPAPPVRQTRLAPVQVREVPAIHPPKVLFTDITQDAGIEFKHNNGATGAKLLPETMGGGMALFDYDNDGDQDLLFVNSMDWPDDPSSGRSNTLALYENRGGTFVDVTAGSGLDVAMYGMGVACGDFDNDGLVDLFITAVGPNRLFRNLGEGRFADVTDSAGVAGEADRWGTSCGWFDFDNDADLDLFVCNYVQWSKAYDVSQNFQLIGGGRAYGRPQNFEGTFPYLYRNDGQGKFTDVSQAAGIQLRNLDTGVPLCKSLGLAICDLDQNGYLDLLVANDTVQNVLLSNNGDGTFNDIGTLSGIAFDSGGNARGAMGIDVTTFRDDKSVAVAIGNFANEMTALYVSRLGRTQFVDEAISTGLGPSTRLQLTFGLFYFDFDLDCRLDLFAANGHLEEDINRVQPSQHYEQSPQLFWNAGPQYGTEFLAVAADQSGDDLFVPMVGRGAGYADIDNDGDLDVLVTATGRKPRLLRNDSQLDHHWIRFKLVGDGEHCNRDAIGSWIQVTVGDQVLRKQVMPTRSYLSQVELPVTFGLAGADEIAAVEIHWCDGQRQVLGSLPVDQLHTIQYAPQAQPGQAESS
jgi:hypothetical protein